MDRPNDPLRSGAIFKLNIGSLRSPPKIVKFDVAKAPVNTSNTKTGISQVREAFEGVYRQTPTPKFFLSRSAGGITENMSSPYWSSSLSPHTQLDVNHNRDSAIQKETNTNAHVNEANISEINIKPLHTTNSVHSASDADADADSDISNEGIAYTPSMKQQSSMADQQLTDKYESKVTQKPHIDTGNEESAAEPDMASSSSGNKPVRSATSTAAVSSTSAGSRTTTGSSRSRGRGADSLLLLVAGGSKPDAPSSSSARLAATGVRGTSTGRGSRTTSSASISSVATSAANPRKEGMVEVTTNTLLHTARSNVKGLDVTHNQVRHESVAAEGTVQTKSVEKEPTIPPVKKATSRARKDVISAATIDDNFDTPKVQNMTSAVSPPAIGKTNDAASKASGSGAKRKRLAASEESSEQSEEDTTSSAKQSRSVEKEPDEEEVTVTRSGRKSIPKKTIPLAEDITQSGKSSSYYTTFTRFKDLPVVILSFSYLCIYRKTATKG